MALIYFSAFLNLGHQQEFYHKLQSVMLLVDTIPSDNGTSKFEGQWLTSVTLRVFPHSKLLQMHEFKTQQILLYETSNSKVKLLVAVAFQTKNIFNRYFCF